MESESSLADAPVISPDLVGPPPRTVQLTGNGIVLAIVTAAIIAAAIVCFCLIGSEAVRQLQTRTALRRANNQTIGQIEKLRSPYPLKFYVDYTFLADGNTYAGEAIVPLEDVHIFKPATNLSVSYPPENPAINHPVDWEWSVFSEWDPVFVVILVAGLGCLLFLLPQMLFERRLAAQGLATTGVVTKCSVSGRGGQFINLKYYFRTQDGSSIQGRGDFKTQQEIGAKVLDLYLPQNPKKNVPYPLSAWRIAEAK
jgi:hypothetical protein